MSKRWVIPLLGILAAFSALAAEKVDSKVVMSDKVAKFWKLLPVEKPADLSKPEAIALPTEPDSQWGQWKFWNGQWWAQCLLQNETEGNSWTPPAGGFKKPIGNYRGAWLKARMDVPRHWDGCRLIYSQTGIKNCDVGLWINGTFAGVIKQPAGELDVTKFVKVAAPNEFAMLMSGAKDARFKFEKDPPFLTAKSPVCIEDVFANTSWRQKKLTVETEITVPNDCSAIVSAQVLDAAGKVVKEVSGKFSLKAGTSVVKPSVDWKNPITWELGRGYLYTLKTQAKINGKTISYKDVKFGFREIWRDERKIFMNGHEQKYRVTYNFGCNRYGAKFLTGVGYNCIQFAHQTSLDPTLNEEDLQYFSEHGIAIVAPTTAFDWNTKNPLLKPGEKREAFKRLQAMNLRKYRNYPCLAMVYMGVNTYLPQWAYEAVHLGSGDNGDFAKMMTDLVAAAKETNPNILYFSHSDGNTGEIASANLYLNWIPLQERESWPSRWAERGHFPFQACEFGHPYQYSWYKDERDLITEYCAIYYGEEAYRLEPRTIQERHIESLYIRRLQHPLFWKLTEDFCWRTTRAWRTFGVNAGIVWFNLDYGYGMPGWTIEGIYNKYGPNYGFFKSEADIPKGKPEWAFPSWDIYRKGNLDFLGWIAGYPRITDRRHAYYPGEKIVKRNVMMWDGFDNRSFVAEWTATVGGQKVASGRFKRALTSNRPVSDKIAFAAPEVRQKTAGEIKVVYRNANGAEEFVDTCAFEVYPRKAVKWEKAPEFALYDPDGQTEPALRKLGLVNLRKVASPADFGTATRLVVGSFALGKDGYMALPMEAVEKGLKVLVLPQNADAWKGFGFDVQDRMSRILFIRDRTSPAWKKLDDDYVREWNGAPRTQQKNAYNRQQYGSLVKHQKHEPRWTYEMAVAALQLRSPDVVGYTPVVEGELDMNYAALLRYRRGKGEVLFCTLDFLGRIDTSAPEGAADISATDPAIEQTAAAVFADFCGKGAEPAARAVIADGTTAQKIAAELGVKTVVKPQADAGELLLVGPDGKTSAAQVVAAANRGANVLVLCNDTVAKGLGFVLKPCGPDVYWVKFDHQNSDLQGIGQSQLRWRERMKYSVLQQGSAPSGTRIDGEGIFASMRFKGGGTVFVSQYDPYYLENKIATAEFYFVNNKKNPVSEKNRARDLKHGDLSFERGRQFTARLLTNLGASPTAGEVKLYNGLKSTFDPYLYTYW